MACLQKQEKQGDVVSGFTELGASTSGIPAQIAEVDKEVWPMDLYACILLYTFFYFCNNFTSSIILYVSQCMSCHEIPLPGSYHHALHYNLCMHPAP